MVLGERRHDLGVVHDKGGVDAFILQEVSYLFCGVVGAVTACAIPRVKSSDWDDTLLKFGPRDGIPGAR